MCDYRSGNFKPSELQYHSTFKEIFAVKRGIEKFQFHLIGHRFFIEMDMSSFPKTLQFKRKIMWLQILIQLLRWSNWFSQWTFDVNHIKGKDIVVADFFFRPPKVSPFTTISLSSSTMVPCVCPLDPFLGNIQHLLPEIRRLIFEQVLPRRSITNFKRFLEITIFRHGLVLSGLEFHPKYPFLSCFHINDVFSIPKEAIYFL